MDSSLTEGKPKVKIKIKSNNHPSSLSYLDDEDDEEEDDNFESSLFSNGDDNIDEKSDDDSDKPIDIVLMKICL